LIKVILDGAGQVSSGPLSPAHPGFDPSLKPYRYDVAQAKKLLAEAGYAEGFSITFQSPRGRFAKDQQVAEALVGQLAPVGIKLNANVMEYTTLLKVYRKEGHGFILPANMTTTQRQLDAYFSSTKKMFAWYGYVNPKVDELLDIASKTFKRDRRLNYYSQASRIIRDEAGFLYLFDEQHLYGVRDRVKNWKPRGDELVLLGGTSVEG
jgi:peptide/nickel transport system substrate-binding protein